MTKASSHDPPLTKTVGVDHLKKRVVWVGEGKGEKTLLKFFDELGPQRSQALTHVTMDMSAAYRAAVQARAPQAQKVFDRFHVQKLASEAVDTVRRQQVGLLGASQKGRAERHLAASRWPRQVLARRVSTPKR